MLSLNSSRIPFLLVLPLTYAALAVSELPFWALCAAAYVLTSLVMLLVIDHDGDDLDGLTAAIIDSVLARVVTVDTITREEAAGIILLSQSRTKFVYRSQTVDVVPADDEGTVYDLAQRARR